MNNKSKAFRISFIVINFVISAVLTVASTSQAEADVVTNPTSLNITIEEQAANFDFAGQMNCAYEGSGVTLWNVQLIDMSSDPNIEAFKTGLAKKNIQLLSKVYASETGLLVMNVKTPEQNNNEPSVLVIESAKPGSSPLYYNISSIEGSVIRSKHPNYSDLLFSVQAK